MHLQPNTTLQGDKYRIVRFISSGGFGCTYEAEHVMLGERVAIKEFFVKDFCNRDERTAHVTVGTQSKKGLVDKLKKKFIEEAKVLYHIQHPGIVRVFDIFEENGTAYFVMDYIDGPSLNEIVTQEGALPEARAVRYIRQVAEALKFVHSKDRLHLDIKPSNIMVNSQDNAILIDFGASKQYDEVDGENTSTLIGKTPGYAPLEQMGNDVVKFMPATDIYALGATLYKLLTGITPLSANLLASGEELESLPADVSPSVREAIMKAMSINKNKRPQTIEDLLTLLGGETKVSQSSQKSKKQAQPNREEETKLTNEEETLVIGESQKEREATEPVKIDTRNWKEHFKERHPIVNLTMAAMMVGAILGLIFLVIILSICLSVEDFLVDYYPWTPYYWDIAFIIPILIIVIFGLVELFKNRQSGYWLMAMCIPIVNCLLPLSVLITYDHYYDLFLFDSLFYCFVWVMVPMICLLLFYIILGIKCKGERHIGISAWSLMKTSPIWMKRATWISWIIFGIAIFAVFL